MTRSLPKESQYWWDKVKEAQKRIKCEKGRPGDQEMCELAFRADPDRYKKQGQEVREEVTEEMRSLFYPRK